MFSPCAIFFRNSITIKYCEKFKNLAGIPLQTINRAFIFAAWNASDYAINIMNVWKKTSVLPRNIIIASGALVLVYLILKFFKSNRDKPSKKDSNTNEEITKEDSTEAAQPVVKPTKNRKNMKNFKLKPNFFLAFQVNNVGIHKKVKELQEKLISKNPLLYSGLIQISTLHVTLAVTHLANETDVKTLKSKLDEWAEKNVKVFFKEPCIVSFSGVNSFNNVVAYVDIDQCSNYKKVLEVCESFRNLLTSNGFTVDNKSIKPHLTFLKLTKDIKLLRFKKNYKNDFESLKNFKDHIGKQEITSIQLLSMDEPKDEAGYYKCYHEIKISDTESDMNHKECCSRIPQPKALINKEIKSKFQSSKNKK